MSTTNHLAQETSPYLKQHADNPVDWYPWGPEALEKAKSENKPILLSIGYSACHWCHVMAHESFSDNETAQIMNELFINIKVDKEERPDLDMIYQTIHQLLTSKGGGWPLTVCLDPQQRLPFFTGTYFPKEPRYQLPAFKGLLQNIADFYKKYQREIGEQGEKVSNALKHFPPPDLYANSHDLNLEPWQLAIQQLAAEFDSVYGGFGAAPKFPNAVYLELLIDDICLTKTALADNESWKILEATLIKMALGGIYDQIGGGFYRYSVDAQWEIPHFEKMLYDNAQLLNVYARANQLKPNFLFEKTMQETAMWVMRNMQSPRGGYYSTLNADSEGKEGYFYVWTREQIQSLLDPEEYEKVSLYFNLQAKPNFEFFWHFQRVNTDEEIAKKTQESLGQVKNQIASGVAKLYEAREKRIHPSRDEKILTGWNALMIKGMLLTGIQLNRPEFIESAERALNFIYSDLWKNGRLLASYKDGSARLPAYLDDYAFLLDTVLVLLQHRWRTQDLLFAQALADALLEFFLDTEHGGFFFVANDHEKLIYRPKTFTDGVMPSGNGIACFALQRLGYLLGEKRYLTAVEKALQAAWPFIQKAPAMHSSLLIALHEYLTPPEIIIIRGKDTEIQQWKTNIIQSNTPERLIFGISVDEVNMPGAIADKKPLDAGPIAYVCKGQQCLPSITNCEELKETLQKNSLNQTS